MYIIYQGEVGIFGDLECTQQWAILKANEVVGEKALENNNNRGATVKAMTFTTLLRLKKIYF